jgi:hypothetical protein
MSKRARRASHYLLIAIMMVAMGGHLALLQTVAWGRMLMTYSNGTTMAVAVEKTFDGGHPCSLCKLVSRTKSEEKEKNAALRPEMGMHVAIPASIAVPMPRETEVDLVIPAYGGHMSKVFLAVPMQPPRLA